MTSKYSVANAKLTNGKFNHAQWYPPPPSGPPPSDQLPPLPKEDKNHAQSPPPPSGPPPSDQLKPKLVPRPVSLTPRVAQPDSSTQENKKSITSSHNKWNTAETTLPNKSGVNLDRTSPVSSSEDTSDPPPPGDSGEPVCPLPKCPAVPEVKTVTPIMPWRRSSSQSTQSSEPDGDNRSVYVGKLNPMTTSDSLRKTFSKYGTVLECRVIVHRQGSIKLCYGFVTYSNRSDAEKAIAETNGMYLASRTIRTNWALRSWSTYNPATNETNPPTDYDSYNVDRSKPSAQSSSYPAANDEVDNMEVANPDTISKDEDAHFTPKDLDEPTVSSSQVEVFPFPPTSKLFSVYDVKTHSVVGPLSDLSDLSTLDVIDEIRAAKAWSKVKSARLNDANVYVIQFSPRSRIAEEIHSLYFNHLERAEKIGVVRTSSVVDFFYIVPLAKDSRLPPVLISILPYRVLRTIKERTSNLLLGILTRGSKFQKIMTRKSNAF